MKLKGIKSNNAPKPAGPYSQAVLAGNFVFCSGQIGMDSRKGSLVKGSIEKETEQAMKNISAILSKAGTSLNNVVRVDIFLADMSNFDKFNGVYSKYFTREPKPARQTVEVPRLPKNARIEISCIACMD